MSAFANAITSAKKIGSDLSAVFIQDGFYKNEKGVRSFDSSKINGKDVILKNLTNFSKAHKVTCLVSIVALPILAMLIGKIAMIVGLGLSLGVILGLAYLNGKETTFAQKMSNKVKGVFSGIHNPFPKKPA